MVSKNLIMAFYLFLIVALAISFRKYVPMSDISQTNNALVGASIGLIISILLWEFWGKNNAE